VIGNPLLLGDEGYQIQRSLRFRSSASAYLNRTPASASNRRTWTWSGWVKRGALGVGYLFGATTDSWSVNWTLIYLSSANALIVQDYATTERFNLTTTMVFRDPSAWYHLVVAVDTTQATASNRIKIYVNGVQVTALNTAVYPTQNLDTFVDNNVAHQVNGTGGYFDGYMAEVNFIDGQALTPSSFGAINATTGVWSATKYAGTYGTNGFYLNFTDNSAATATTIGKDFSGNGNNWTPNNISVTAGVTYDSMLDAPLGAGGGERGNYATWNPIVSIGNSTFSNGNLTATNGTSGASTCTVHVYFGKYYAEFSPSVLGSTNARLIGIFAYSAGDSLAQYIAKCVAYQPDGTKRINSTSSSYGASYTTADVIGVSLDLDNNTIEFFKNNTSQGVINTTLSQPAGTLWTFGSAQGGAVSSSVVANFGQRPFSYTPPTGFKALHTGNLGAPVIALPAQNMAATLYTGNGYPTAGTQSIANAVNGVSFQPDFVWIKRRDAAASHTLTDSVRGVNSQLFSNQTAAQETNTDAVTALNSNGFSLGTGTSGTYPSVNNNGGTYVGWQWKAGGTAVSNTAGSITSSVSANTTAGFSVVTYTGNGTAGATVGHGLGAAPSLILPKVRSRSGDNWHSYHVSLGGTQGILLNATNAASTDSGFWNNTNPSSTVFTVGTYNTFNTQTYVAYCFAPVAGYSAFGSYTGNGSADGPFVYLGFRPRWLMIKCSSTDGGGTSQWMMVDSARNTGNVENNILKADLADAEGVGSLDMCDFLSNGLKIRNTSGRTNTSGATYIYMAFAESPFKNSLAR